jgi:hypothetical protein
MLFAHSFVSRNLTSTRAQEIPIHLESLAGRKIQSEPSAHNSRSVPIVINLSNTSSQAARRDQNRIAQREFRLRKQQRVCHDLVIPCPINRAQLLSFIQIRDLEARVEILSGGKDEALGEMRNMLKGGRHDVTKLSYSYLHVI